MGTSRVAFTLLRGAVAVLAAGWLAAGSCHVAYTSCNHEPGDCSAPKHDRDCACFEGSSADSAAVPPRAIAFEVEVDALGRSRVRRWLLTERGPIALDRPPRSPQPPRPPRLNGDGWQGDPPFTSP